jgi:uncharacterized membrane protein
MTTYAQFRLGFLCVLLGIALSMALQGAIDGRWSAAGVMLMLAFLLLVVGWIQHRQATGRMDRTTRTVAGVVLVVIVGGVLLARVFAPS